MLDAYTMYKTFNVGFHHFLPQQRNYTNIQGDKLTRVYRPRIPPYAVLRPEVGLVELRKHQCREGQGVWMCDLNAVDANPLREPCLEMLYNESKTFTRMCYEAAERLLEPAGTYAVVNTPSGSLVRAPNQKVIAFQELAKQLPNPKKDAHDLTPSKGGVFWVDFSKYKSFMVGKRMFAPQGSDLYVSIIRRDPLHVPLAPNIGFDRIQVPELVVPGSISERSFQALTQGLQKELETNFVDKYPMIKVAPGHATSLFTGTNLLIFGTLILIITVLMYRMGYCFCAGSKARRPGSCRYSNVDIQKEIASAERAAMDFLEHTCDRQDNRMDRMEEAD